MRFDWHEPTECEAECSTCYDLFPKEEEREMALRKFCRISDDTKYTVASLGCVLYYMKTFMTVSTKMKNRTCRVEDLDVQDGFYATRSQSESALNNDNLNP